ncbi:hypothetical protein [Pseudomonas sp. NPDC087639]|uniref:hypothetical protein n=1 Tax=Pseudomonas sp. NPDC087639 TaxID=3364445 RepID=UPI0038268EA5
MNDQYVSIACPTLQPLEPILHSWISCTRRYIDVWDGDDLPYWYNEQANVSILAGAAWRADWTAIEEYQISKIATEANEQTASIGRNDLYIANEEHGFCIEAKVAYVDINEIEKAKKHIAARRDQATGDARRVDYHEPRLGAVFVAPYSLGSKADEQQIRAFQQEILTLDSQALAWVSPTKAQKTRSHDNRYYPLVALLLMTI